MPDRVRVTRRKFAATGAALAAGSIFAPAVNAAPAGVTLQAIDGETISNPLDPTSMTHSYYASRGLTFATDKSFNGTSWDDPSFFPIITFFSDTHIPSVTKMKDLGYNVAVAVNVQPANFANFASNGIWYFDVGASHTEFRRDHRRHRQILHGLLRRRTPWRWLSDYNFPNRANCTDGP